MKLHNGLALAAAAISLVLPTAVYADTPAAADSPAAADAAVDASGKKEPSGCVTTAVAKPESEGEGSAKPANSVAASPVQAPANARQLVATEGSGDAKPVDGHQTPQEGCPAA